MNKWRSREIIFMWQIDGKITVTPLCKITITLPWFFSYAAYRANILRAFFEWSIWQIASAQENIVKIIIT